MRVLMALLVGNFKTLDVLAMRGLISPNEIDSIWAEMKFALGELDERETEDIATIVIANLEPMYARSHRYAREAAAR